MNRLLIQRLMQKQLLVIESNIFFLEQGIELLNDLTDELYTGNGIYNKSGVGRHFRHIIEHYFSFNDFSDLKIDYDDRERDVKLETQRTYMISEMERVSAELNKFKSEPELLDIPIKVRSNEGIGQENSPFSTSTLRRELQFLISHTVHHYALIGLILKTMGYEPDPDFGVAPSTLRYEKEKFSKA